MYCNIIDKEKMEVKTSNNCFNLTNTAYLQVKQMLYGRLRRKKIDKKSKSYYTLSCMEEYTNWLLFAYLMKLNPNCKH